MACLLFSISVTDKSSWYTVNAKRTLSFSMCFENERLWNNLHRKLNDAINLFEHSYIVKRSNNKQRKYLRDNDYAKNIYLSPTCHKYLQRWENPNKEQYQINSSKALKKFQSVTVVISSNIFITLHSFASISIARLLISLTLSLSLSFIQESTNIHHISNKNTEAQSE